MAKSRKQRKKAYHNNKVVNLANVKKNAKAPKYTASIAPKTVARTRQDIANWNRALQLTRLQENPKWYLLQQLYDEVSLDALFTSQYKNRQLKALSQRIVLKKPNGDIDEEQTKLLNDAIFTNEINRHILDSKYRRVSLIELSFDADGTLKVDLIPRENLDPEGGFLYLDYSEDKKIDYRNVKEYGTWLLEFGEKKDVGLINNAVPHILFKRFAISCWSELAEINGIPPRVLKTNTQDPAALSRGEKMMKDMGAAAWFIIDQNENFEWASSAVQSGDVYNKLINLCNNEISLLMTGAVIGQDTKNGSRSKDESGQEMLNTLIESDMRLVEQYWNSKVIPALVQIGVLKGELTYGYEQTEDINQLWTMTKEILPYKNVSDDWIKEKFGIEVTGDKQQAQQKLNLGADFFD